MKKLVLALLFALTACGGGGSSAEPTAIAAVEVVDGYTKLSSYYALDSGPMDNRAIAYGNSWEGDQPYSPDYQIVRITPDVPIDALAVTVSIKTKVVVPDGVPSYAQLDARLSRDPVWTDQNHSAHIEGWGGGDKGEYREVKYTSETVLLSSGGFWMIVGVGVVGTGQLELGITVEGYWK